MTYNPWSVVSTGVGLYRHFGVVLPDGTVVHASKAAKRVVRSSIEEFRGAKDMRIESSFRPHLSDAEMLQRVSQTLGQKYDLCSKNCEHLVRHILGLKLRSPQLAAAGGAIGVGFLLYLMLSNR